jgi:hypothetical protein
LDASAQHEPLAQVPIYPPASLKVFLAADLGDWGDKDNAINDYTPLTGYIKDYPERPSQKNIQQD